MTFDVATLNGSITPRPSSRPPAADIRHGGDQAYCAVHPDYVQMPPFECFEDPEAYYATLAHECTHRTRHPTRLDRGFGRKRWGDDGYAREELVAELGAAFLCAELGLELTPREDHAAYIESWLQVLRGDKRFHLCRGGPRPASYRLPSGFCRPRSRSEPANSVGSTSSARWCRLPLCAT